MAADGRQLRRSTGDLNAHASGRDLISSIFLFKVLDVKKQGPNCVFC
jgi:hypothetical protein